MTDDNHGKGIPDFNVFKASKAQEQLIQMRQNLTLLKDSMDIIEEYQAIVAKIKYNKYTSLIAAGFNEPQALTIVTQSSELL